MQRLLPALIALALCACAAKPVLYPNSRYIEAGKKQSREDIAACDALADEYIKAVKNKQIAGDALEGGVTGAAAGAVTGAVFGELGRGAASGGIAGATIGLVRGMFRTHQPSPARRGFVDRCLRERGYEVVGWE